MNGSSSGGGIQLSSALRTGGGGGSGTSSKNPVFQQGIQFNLGAPGSDFARNWMFEISPLSNDKNALLVKYKKDGSWQTASVYTAKSD